MPKVKQAALAITSCLKYQQKAPSVAAVLLLDHRISNELSII